MAACLFGGYVALWKYRTWHQTRVSGISPEVIHHDRRPSQVFFAKVLQTLVISAVAYIAIHFSGAFKTSPASSLDRVIVDLTGILVGVSGLWICFIAQRTMGKSWRVGIDRQNAADLITTGIFSAIRNPTYSGLFMVCLGFYLIISTKAVAVWTAIFFTAIEFQVRLEEEHLEALHGQRYRRYCEQTKRYIPLIY